MDHSITDRQPGAWIVRKSSKREYPPTRTSPGMEQVSWAPFVQVDTRVAVPLEMNINEDLRCWCWSCFRPFPIFVSSSIEMNYTVERTRNMISFNHSVTFH